MDGGLTTWGLRPRLYAGAPSGLLDLAVTGDFDGSLADGGSRGGVVRILSTSARRIDCQVLAEELAPLEVAWTATDPSAVTGPGLETARWLLQCCQRLYEL